MNRIILTVMGGLACKLGKYRLEKSESNLVRLLTVSLVLGLLLASNLCEIVMVCTLLTAL